MRSTSAVLLSLAAAGCQSTLDAPPRATPRVRQVTTAPTGHVLTNHAAWSHDSRWLVYDVRSDETAFSGETIERVEVDTGRVEVLYRAARDARVGVVTASPADDRVVFIHGPETPTDDWQYGAYHRRGAIVHTDKPGSAVNLDARDITPPFTPGALRGGSHVHTFSGDGRWVSFTYEDHVLATAPDDPPHEPNQRNIGVSAPLARVTVDRDHPRNHDGEMFTVLVTRTVADPAPGSDQISKAFEDAWVGTDGYIRADGSHQRRAIAFQGHVVTPAGDTISEVFIVDLPDDLTIPGQGPLEGTATTMPRPPQGCAQRRLTFTADRQHPGLQGPRHWLRSSPDGSRIAFLMKDDAGIVQLWTISPRGGQPRQVTRNPWDVASAFSWSPDGESLAYITDHSVFVTDAASGKSTRLTPRSDTPPSPLACLFSPDGRRIAWMQRVTDDAGSFDQIFVVDVE